MTSDDIKQASEPDEVTAETVSVEVSDDSSLTAVSNTKDKEKKNAEKGSKKNLVLTIIGIVLCVILVPILVINITLIIQSFTNKDSVPNIGGIFPMIVLTDSMYPEIKSGDLIVCKQTDTSKIQVGDVITFYDPAGNGTSTVTHRVTEITEKDGSLAFMTKGDNNNTEDKDPVPAEKVIGRYSFKIPGLGNVAMFMQTTPGLIVCVILPLVALVAYDVIKSRLYQKKKAEDNEALLKELEELKAKQNAQNKDE